MIWMLTHQNAIWCVFSFLWWMEFMFPTFLVLQRLTTYLSTVYQTIIFLRKKFIPVAGWIAQWKWGLQGTNLNSDDIIFLWPLHFRIAWCIYLFHNDKFKLVRRTFIIYTNVNYLQHLAKGVNTMLIKLINTRYIFVYLYVCNYSIFVTILTARKEGDRSSTLQF